MLARKGRLQVEQILISTCLEYQKSRASLTPFGRRKRILSFRCAEADFLRNTINIDCAKHNFSVQSINSLCRAYFTCARRIFSVQSLRHTVQSDLHTVQTDLHCVQSDLYSVQGDLHIVQSKLHTVQGDLHIVQGVRRACRAIDAFFNRRQMTFRAVRGNLFFLLNNRQTREFITHLWLKSLLSTIRKNAAKFASKTARAGWKSSSVRCFREKRRIDSPPETRAISRGRKFRFSNRRLISLFGRGNRLAFGNDTRLDSGFVGKRDARTNRRRIRKSSASTKDSFSIWKFRTRSIFWQISGKRVIVAGLDQDYTGRPFEPMPQLVGGRRIYHENSRHLRQMRRTRRIIRSVRSNRTARVEVGASDKYEARCRKCFVPHSDTPTVHD